MCRNVPASRVYIPQSTDDAQGLMEDGIGSVVILLGDGKSRATTACLAAMEQLAAEYDPDHVLFAHVDPQLLPQPQEPSDRDARRKRGSGGVGRIPALRSDGAPTVLCCRDGEVLDATVGRLCCGRLRRQVDRLLRDDPGPSLLTRLFRFASGA